MNEHSNVWTPWHLASVTINKLFFTIKRPRSSKNSFFCTSIFLKGSSTTKKIGDRISKQICHLLYWLSFLFSCQQIVHFLFKHLAIWPWFASTCFFKDVIPLVLHNEINHFLNYVFGFVAFTGLLWQSIQHIICGFPISTFVLSLT
jgi:hypothetical protein